MDRESRKRASNDSRKQSYTEEPEEEEPEDSPPGSEKRDFQQVTKSEPNGISACGLRHPLLLVEIYPYTTGASGKRQGTCVLEGSKISPNLIGYIATCSAGHKWWKGQRPLPRSLDWAYDEKLLTFLVVGNKGFRDGLPPGVDLNLTSTHLNLFWERKLNLKS